MSAPAHRGGFLSATTHAHIDRARLAGLLDRERGGSPTEHPRSRELYAETLEDAAGRRADELDDDVGGWLPAVLRGGPAARAWSMWTASATSTSASATPAPWPATRREPTARAVERQIRRGTTVMLPSEDAAWVGRELVRRFGLDAWQFSLTATDANRWVASHGAAADRPAQGAGVQLLLPRHRRRVVDRAQGRRAALAAGQRRAAVRSHHHHQGGRVQRPGGARAGAGAGDVAGGAGRAGADQHRHRAARSRLPRGDARDHPRAPARC